MRIRQSWLVQCIARKAHGDFEMAIPPLVIIQNRHRELQVVNLHAHVYPTSQLNVNLLVNVILWIQLKGALTWMGRGGTYLLSRSDP